GWRCCVGWVRESASGAPALRRTTGNSAESARAAGFGTGGRWEVAFRWDSPSAELWKPIKGAYSATASPPGADGGFPAPVGLVKVAMCGSNSAQRIFGSPNRFDFAHPRAGDIAST